MKSKGVEFIWTIEGVGMGRNLDNENSKNKTKTIPSLSAQTEPNLF